MTEAAGWWRVLPGGKPISALGFGCSSLWAKPDFAEASADAVLDAAWASGINHFDTAPSYGNGLGEARLGRFVHTVGADALVLSTKIGSNLIDGQVVRSFGRDLIARSFADSLERLGVSRVDILYLHGPSRTDLSPDLFAFLEGERAAGRVGLVGLESGDPGMFEVLPDLAIDVAMLHYNVGDPSTGPLIERLATAGKTIVSGTVLAQSKFAMRQFVPTDIKSLWYLLRMAKNDPLFWLHGPRLARRLAAVGDDAHAVAVGFVTGHPKITSGVFGSTNPTHVIANAEAGKRPLTVEQRAKIAGAE